MAEMRDVAQSGALPVETNRLVRNTFILLSMVLGVAAVGAGVGLFSGITWGIGMWIAFMVVFIGGPFLLNAIKNGQTAIIATFVWAGLVGFLLSPLVSAYLAMPGGSSIVLNALVTTAVLFVALAGYAVVSKRDFSFMGGSTIPVADRLDLDGNPLPIAADPNGFLTSHGDGKGRFLDLNPRIGRPNYYANVAGRNPARAVVVLGVLAFAVATVFGALGGGSYGDDPELDRLYDACAAGDGWSCDELYWQSPLNSEYEEFGDTCGFRFPPQEVYCEGNI